MPDPLAADEVAVRDAEDARYDALVRADWDALEELFAPELRYTHSSGTTDTRESYLAKLRGGYYRYHGVEHPIDAVVLDRDAAVVVGRMDAEISVDGARRSLRNTSLAVWVRRSGGWKLLAYAPTPSPTPTPTPTPTPSPTPTRGAAPSPTP
jgi:hypothetical protein